MDKSACVANDTSLFQTKIMCKNIDIDSDTNKDEIKVECPIGFYANIFEKISPK